MLRRKAFLARLVFGMMLACCVAAAPQKTTTLKYGDGKADGKQSLGGSGEMVSYELPSERSKVAGLRIHASRYGLAQPPRESFLIYFLSPDEKRILHTEMAPYSLFLRGQERWVEAKFERPIELPKEFWVVVDFRAHQNKGVYVSYDKSTGGKHSRVGLPGISSSETKFGGDWLVELLLDEPSTSSAGKETTGKKPGDAKDPDPAPR